MQSYKTTDSFAPLLLAALPHLLADTFGHPTLVRINPKGVTIQYLWLLGEEALEETLALKPSNEFISHNRIFGHVHKIRCLWEGECLVVQAMWERGFSVEIFEFFDQHIIVKAWFSKDAFPISENTPAVMQVRLDKVDQ